MGPMGDGRSLRYRATDRLLDGGDGPEPLRRLLAAATGPATRAELAGEAAAVEAFVAAGSGRGRHTKTGSRAGMRMARVATVVALAGAAGSVAVAAAATVSDPDVRSGPSVLRPVEHAGPQPTLLPEDPARRAPQPGYGPTGNGPVAARPPAACPECDAGPTAAADLTPSAAPSRTGEAKSAGGTPRRTTSPAAESEKPDHAPATTPVRPSSKPPEGRDT